MYCAYGKCSHAPFCHHQYPPEIWDSWDSTSSNIVSHWKPFQVSISDVGEKRARLICFTWRTIHKIHTFVKEQQDSNKIKHLFRQGEMNTLLKDCHRGIKQALTVFKASVLVLHRVGIEWETRFRLRLVPTISAVLLKWRNEHKKCIRNCWKWFQHSLMQRRRTDHLLYVEPLPVTLNTTNNHQIYQGHVTQNRYGHGESLDRWLYTLFVFVQFKIIFHDAA
jgi:hypothetical protein